MAFILSGGLRDAPSSPTAVHARPVLRGGGGFHGGAMVSMTSSLRPQQQQQHTRVMGGCNALAPPQLLATSPPHYDSHKQFVQIRTAFQSGLRSAPPRYSSNIGGSYSRQAGGADAVETTMVVRERDDDGDDDEAHMHATPHDRHVDVEIEAHSTDSAGDYQQAEEHLTVTLPRSSSSKTSMQTTLVFHTSDKLLHAIEKHRKAIVQAYVSDDLRAVQQHLTDVLQELHWPRVCLQHHHVHHGNASETTTYKHGTMPAPGGDIQVLYSSKSLTPHTRIIQLCGWLLPWGAYESLVTVKWRTPPSASDKKKSAMKVQGGAPAGGREKGACHSGRSRGRGFSLQKNTMQERVHGGANYALWMLDDHSNESTTTTTITPITQNSTHTHVSEDLQCLQRAFATQRHSNDAQCNVSVVHEVDHDGRELTWLEINQHVAPDTLLCANLDNFYARVPTQHVRVM